jgi:NNP family nitrate/nitrite transporter-like MFS transporter
LFLLRGQWLRWSSTASQAHDGVAIGGAHAME